MPRKRTGSPMRLLHEEAEAASRARPRVRAVPKIPPPDAVEMATRVQGKQRSDSRPDRRPKRRTRH
jgi:hypothetical protein